MADLSYGGTSNGNGVHPPRPTAAPQPTGSPSIRGPRAIMRDRQEREARKAEQERREQEDRQQQLQEARRREQERQTAAQYAAGAAPPSGVPGQRRQTSADHGRSSRTTQPSTTQAGAGTVPPLRPRGNTAGEAYGHAHPTTGESSHPTATQSTRNTFPHAFERWEALSAHWEGLTSFWIRKLEQNSAELERDPVSTQLSRQVTDLSAAGANLFHAVVELQRLRASSERKFQRWFFETRSEIEKLQEQNGLLQQSLERTKNIRDEEEDLRRERENSRLQKQLSDMKKELSISKEEARRAWDELGRREQEERDRVGNLQSGLPVVIGGVQVVPMTQSVPSRQGSQREPPRSEYPEYSQAPPTTTTSSSAGQGYYAPSGPEGSETTYSEEYDDPAAYPPSSGYARSGADYSGQGYSAWEAPRHHHPTRLSDVPEEDERSRTSASALSRRNA